MAAVRFAFGNRPSTAGHEAADIADLLYLRRNLESHQLAGRIRHQAERDPEKGETGKDVHLNSREMTILLTLLAEDPEAPASDAITQLCHELRLALDQASPRPQRDETRRT